MGVLLETAKFLEEEINPSQEEISEFRDLLAEDVKSEFLNIINGLKRNAAARAELLKRKASMAKPAFDGAMARLAAETAKLKNGLAALRTRSQGAGKLLSKATTAAKSAPMPVKIAAGAALAGAGAYAMYKKRKADRAK